MKLTNEQLSNLRESHRRIAASHVPREVKERQQMYVDLLDELIDLRASHLGILTDALRDTLEIVEEYRSSIIDSHTAPGPDGQPDMSTLDELAKDDVNHYGDVIWNAQKALGAA